MLRYILACSLFLFSAPAYAQVIVTFGGGGQVDAQGISDAGGVLEADFEANSILAATADDTPVAVTIGASELVGRAAAGGPAALTAAQVRTILNVEDGADVTDAANVEAAGAVMDSDIAPAEGILRKTGAGAYTAIQSNLGTAGAPTINDDAGAGYGLWSPWIDSTADRLYVAVDATVGAAVWLDLLSAADISVLVQPYDANTTVLGPSITLGTETDGNYVESVGTSALTGLTGGAAGSEGAALTLALDYSATITSDPALAAGACVFGTTGLICEGATADGFEALVTFADPTADRTITLPNATDTLVGRATTDTLTSKTLTTPTLSNDAVFAQGQIGRSGDVLQFRTAAGTQTVLLGTSVGTSVQAWDAELDEIAALAPAAGDLLCYTGGAWTLLANSGGAASEVLTWASGACPTYEPISGGGGGFIQTFHISSQTADDYLSLHRDDESATETDVDTFYAPSACTARNLFVEIATSPGSGDSWAFTLRDDASSTALTCTISGTTQKDCSELIATAAIAQGSKLTIFQDGTGTPVGAGTVALTFQCN